LERGERPATVEKEKRVLGADEIGRLLDAADAKYRPLLATAVGTGLRLGELLGLRWADVDLEGGCSRRTGSRRSPAGWRGRAIRCSRRRSGRRSGTTTCAGAASARRWRGPGWRTRSARR
jgi:integrase